MTPKVASKPKRRDWVALDRQHQRRGTLAFTLCKRCYSAVHAAGGRHLAPPKMGAMRWDQKVPAYRQRNRHIDNIHPVGRPAWKKWVKYHRRSAVESAMHHWKWVTGERALSRTLTRLKVEGVLRAKFLNSLIASTAS